MRATLRTTLILSGVAALCPAGLLAVDRAALEQIQAQNIAAHIKRLASDEFQGRAPGTHGETLTVRYLVDQFQRSGLAPGNPDGTYLQAVPLIGYVSQPRLEIGTGGHMTALKFLEDFVHDGVPPRSPWAVKGAGIVFAGYGIVAPEFGWDDYQGVDVRGKLVIVLSGEPASEDPAFFRGPFRTRHSTREAKFELAAARGAAAILVVTDPGKSQTFSIFQTFAKMEECVLDSPVSARPPVMTGLITLAAARRVAQMAGVDFDVLQAGATRRGWRAIRLSPTANISILSRIRRFTSHNVVARVQGSDVRLQDEYVAYSAHWDHLGRDRTVAGDQIYNGAIDNAAGTAQLLEIARGFAALPLKPRRSILFLAVTAEEKGFLGSRYYVQHPLYPIEKTVADINLDGGNVWGVTSDLVTTGYGLSTLDKTLARAAQMQGRKFVEESLDDGALYFASDQIEFAKAGIPAVFPFSGLDYVGKAPAYGAQVWDAYAKNDYHRLSDEVKPNWDLSGAAEDARWLMIAGSLVADDPRRPEWNSGSEFQRH